MASFPFSTTHREGLGPNIYEQDHQQHPELDVPHSPSAHAPIPQGHKFDPSAAHCPVHDHTDHESFSHFTANNSISDPVNQYIGFGERHLGIKNVMHPTVPSAMPSVIPDPALEIMRDSLGFGAGSYGLAAQDAGQPSMPGKPENPRSKPNAFPHTNADCVNLRLQHERVLHPSNQPPLEPSGPPGRPASYQLQQTRSTNWGQDKSSLCTGSSTPIETPQLSAVDHPPGLYPLVVHRPTSKSSPPHNSYGLQADPGLEFPVYSTSPASEVSTRNPASPAPTGAPFYCNRISCPDRGRQFNTRSEFK
jgi:hypothetical protein